MATRKLFLRRVQLLDMRMSLEFFTNSDKKEIKLLRLQTFCTHSPLSEMQPLVGRPEVILCASSRCFRNVILGKKKAEN